MTTTTGVPQPSPAHQHGAHAARYEPGHDDLGYDAGYGGPGYEDAVHDTADGLSTGQLVSRAVEQIGTLVRDELALAQAEMSRKARRAGMGAGLLGGAGLIALYGVGCLVAAGVLGLATVMDGWLAAVIVGVGLLAVAGIVALIGRKDVAQASPPVPREAVAGLKADVDTVKGRLHR